MIPQAELFRVCNQHDGVIGSIVLDGEYICQSLENNEHMINAGTYRCTRDHTGKHRWWKLEDRDGRTNIEIHGGITEDWSLGCILLGKSILHAPNKKELAYSEDALLLFLSKLENLGFEAFDLTIIDCFQK